MDNIAEPPIEIQQRRRLEDEARELGAKRLKLATEVQANTNLIRRRLPEALNFGVPLDTFAKLVGISRQTLYRWREEPGD